MKGRFALTTAFLVTLAGCAEEAREPESFYGDGCILDMEAALCEDCLEFAHVTRLGGDWDSPGFLADAGTMEDIVRDSLGNYWVGQNEEIKVFDPEGTFLKTVGRRGEGPMEFDRPAPMHTDAQGRVHVFDNGNLRISVIDEDLTLVEEKRLPTWISSKAPLDDGERYVVQIDDPEHAGMPLHIIEGSDILKSFGAWDEPGARSGGLPGDGSSQLHLAVSPDGNIFAARRFDYAFAAWSRDGSRLGMLEGRPELNEHGFSPGPPSPDNPLPNLLGKIHMDADGLLWVSLAIRRPDWLENLMAAASGDGSLEPAQGDITRIYHGRVDVIDLGACTRIASESRDQMLIFLDDRTVFGYDVTEVGAPALDVWRMQLTR